MIDLDIVKTSIEKIEANFLKDEKELLELSTSIKNEIKKEQEVIKKRLLAKTYIIDTNVFVNRPDILNYISTDDKVVVSAKVIDELDYLKCNEEISQTVSNAIKNIQSALKRKQIKTDFGKKELLPDEFDKRSPDNLILSMAIMYEKKPETNTVLLTSDNGLQLKSSSDHPTKAIISIKTDRLTTYETYIATLDILNTSYTHLRNKLSVKLFNKNYERLLEEYKKSNNKDKKIHEKIKLIREKYPLLLSDAEINN